MLSNKAVFLVVVGVTWLVFVLSSSDSGAVARVVWNTVVNGLMYHVAFDTDGEMDKR